MEDPMRIDLYTKAVLTVIAAALLLLAVNPWLSRLDAPRGLAVRAAEAQTPATPAPAPSPPAGVPGQAPVVVPGAMTQWWDDCSAMSKETVPASWGRLVSLAPGAFVFETDETIRLVRTAPYETVPLGPGNRPCKMLEIKRTK
jgi:hypothetical protein